MNEEVKFFENLKTKKFFLGGVGGGGRVGGGGQGRCERGGGGGGQGRCERRSEVFF